MFTLCLPYDYLMITSHLFGKYVIYVILVLPHVDLVFSLYAEHAKLPLVCWPYIRIHTAPTTAQRQTVPLTGKPGFSPANRAAHRQTLPLTGKPYPSPANLASHRQTLPFTGKPCFSPANRPSHRQTLPDL